jgi:hypothetical protein
MAALDGTFEKTKLVESDTGRELATLEARSAYLLCFSPDGSQLAYLEDTGQLKVWDLRLVREQLAAMNLDWDFPPFPAAKPIQGTSKLTVSVVDQEYTTDLADHFRGPSGQ